MLIRDNYKNKHRVKKNLLLFKNFKMNQPSKFKHVDSREYLLRFLKNTQQELVYKSKIKQFNLFSL